MIAQITTALLHTAEKIPVEAFTLIASFVEEIIAPIPSPVVMTMAGSIAIAQGKPIVYLLVLSLIGAIGKTLGALFIYVIADKAEDLVFGRFGKFIGVTHEEIENFGKKFKGTWKDIFLLTFLRALPIMSSAVVSIGSGVLKIRLKMYLISTFIGTIIRDFFYLYVGYSGVTALRAMTEGFTNIESIIEVTIGVLVLLFFIGIYVRRRAMTSGKN